MVAIMVTPSLRTLLQKASLEGKITRTNKVETITHKHLATAHRQVQQPGAFQAVLRGAEIHLTHAHAVSAHTPHQRDPVLEARVQRLRARLDDAEYARVVRDVARVDASNAQVEDARMSRIAPQMALGFNVVVTMATCFVAGFFVFKHSSGSDTVGLVGGIVGLIIAMAVEVILVLTRMYSIDAAVDKHVRRRQRIAERSALSTERSS